MHGRKDTIDKTNDHLRAMGLVGQLSLSAVDHKRFSLKLKDAYWLRNLSLPGWTDEQALAPVRKVESDFDRNLKTWAKPSNW